MPYLTFHLQPLRSRHPCQSRTLLAPLVVAPHRKQGRHQPRRLPVPLPLQLLQQQLQEQLQQRQAEPTLTPEVIEDILAELSMLKATFSARDSAAELERDLRELEVANTAEMVPRLDRLERESKEVHIVLQSLQKQIASALAQDDRRSSALHKQPGPLPSLLTGQGYHQASVNELPSGKAWAEDSAAAAAVLEDLQRSRLAEAHNFHEGL
mmetsp:Transcript_31996/g.68137  ORF Transcript_31996/g.68137 Transcript_31996/m.68137 type:complete len:210 (+) Transcript_31996:1073-1702(+)